MRIAPTAALSAAFLLLTLPACTKPAQPSRVAEISHIHGLAVNTDGPEPLWVATHHGLYRGPTKDGGWIHPGGRQDDYMGFSVASGPAFFVSGHEHPRGRNMGVRRSQDGVTWTNVAYDGEVDFHTMAVGRSAPVAIYGWYGRLHRSLDSGQTWTYPAGRGLPPPRDRGPYSPVLSLSVHPTQPQTILVATEQGLYLSTDAGENFKGEGSGPVLTVTFAPSDGEVIYASVHDRGIARSRDGGMQWEMLPWPASDDLPWYLAVDPKEPNRVFAAGRANVFRRSEDGGTTWNKIWPRG